MQPTHFLRRAIAGALALAFAIAITGAGAFAASEFVGKWTTMDTKGAPFTIWLSEDGNAKGDRSGEALSGMWKEEGNAAVINWADGWVSKITKEGNTYKKTASEKGKQVGGAFDAKKVE
jgi:hypothetical protein